MEWKMSDMMEHKEKDTAQRISDPFSWDGHETEAMLAYEGGNRTAKELVAVARVRAENARRFRAQQQQKKRYWTKTGRRQQRRRKNLYQQGQK